MDIHIIDKTFVPFISAAKINERVSELAATINRDYAGKKPLVIGILNGSFIFAADLFRLLTIEAEISFIKLASYKGTSSTGNVVTAIGMEENLKDRHVIIVEDIIDTGKTLHAFMPEIMNRQPASVKIATFLSKPDALKYDVKADYCAFEIENKFVLGYGMDYDGLGRNIPELYVLKEN
ncbi:hypoxanthine phosphoribosyltransferase [Flavipsychrobacter stenotrophus]|uniref:Hypoxanthine phosphoribosyltransferase n=1 Tax=Flavipsychrobacter stenotrophus TaxID=2077091 RepID=A0A2S7SZ41_9BACT|nr:hypoxanthine phosphoribosyltransferase [Flavipsychrobacter stenotrophus]PQJ11786.1 hypoxanthine phosphoribosyltransferase [Flavipsychrobacter stenotrophus]